MFRVITKIRNDTNTIPRPTPVFRATCMLAALPFSDPHQCWKSAFPGPDVSKTTPFPGPHMGMNMDEPSNMML